MVIVSNMNNIYTVSKLKGNFEDLIHIIVDREAYENMIVNVQ